MTIMQKIEKYLLPILDGLNRNPYIGAIRSGMISTIPLTIAGSFFLLFAFPPVPQEWFDSVPLFQWIAEHRAAVLLPFRVTMGLIAIYVVYNTAFYLSQSYNLDGITGGTLSLVAFFLTQSFPAAEIAGTETGLGLVLPLAYLGSAGLAGGIIVSFVSVRIFRFFKEHKLVISLPNSVPPAILRSFEALYPMFTILILFGALHFGPKIINPNADYINIHTIVGKGFSWLSQGVDSLPGALLMVFFICLLWIAGIHGVAIIGAIARPIWLELLDKNSTAYAAGDIPLHIFVEPFYQWYVWIGGSGATIGLVIATLIFARSSSLKSLGKATVVPSLFNINEPVIFSYPVVLNPILAIPFILAPIMMTITSWFAIKFGMVPPNVILAPWTFPAPLGAYISAGGHFSAVLLALFNTALSFLIYVPFLIVYDKQLLLEEQRTEQNN